MRHNRKTTMFVGALLAVTLGLSACETTPDENGGTDDGGVTTTTLGDLTTTTLSDLTTTTAGS